MRSRRQVFAALGATAAIVALSVAGAVPSTVAAKSSGIVTNGGPKATAAQEAQVRAYWTPARMAAAKPMAMPQPKANSNATSNRVPTGKAGKVAGVAPSGTKPSVGSPPAANFVVTDATPTPADYSYPFPFTRFYVDGQLYPGVWPYITVGKLFFNQNGGGYVCSASSVTSAPRQSIWTAGHCTSDGAGHWSSSVLFVPAYRNGAAPYGSFYCPGLVTSSAWFYNGDFTLDMGASYCGTNAAGQTLQSRVGTLGFAWNQSRYQHWNAFGYPQASPFNGAWMTVCEASYATYDARYSGANYQANAIGCDMTGGSSGGPWIMYFKSGNYINGHNDYKWSDQPLAMYSPYFVTLTNHIRCVAAGDASC